jgi:hypothetical protein
MTGPWQIVEGVLGIWHYHLAHQNGDPYTALCGARTMKSNAPLNSWGFKPDHFRTSYCAKCEKIAADQKK